MEPGLGDGGVQGRPLGHDARLSAELVFLEPAFNVGSNELTFLRAASIFRDGAKLSGYAIAEQVIAGRPIGSAGGGGVVRCCRRPGWKYSSAVNG